MEIENYKIHSLAQKVPEMTVGEYRVLKESIKNTGQTSPIITYQGEIADGRHRLKACLELGFQPWIKEYDGDKPIAQYILSTNIRRNLTKLQRHQLIADFAAEIIPQVEAEMKERQKRKSGSTDSVLREPSGQKRETISPGRQAFMVATGATDWEAQQVKSIHDNARELLTEVAQRGGLTPTEKEARRRASGAPKPKKQREETYAQRQIRSIQLTTGKKIGISKEEFDPDFKGTPTEFVDKHGYVQIMTKAELEAGNDQAAFSAWVGAIRNLRVPLRDYLKGEKFKPDNFHAWIKKAREPEKRLQEIRELAGMIMQTRESIDWLLPLLEAKQTNGEHP